MKHLLIIIALLFGLNSSYAMQEAFKRDTVNYSEFSHKVATVTPKTETKPIKKKNTVKRIFQIFQLVVLLFVLFLIIAIGLR